MQYMLLIYGDESAWSSMPPEQIQTVMSAYNAYTQAIKDSGAFISGEPLQPVGTATTVRADGNGVRVLDGPFAETKEQLGGYYLIDVADQDAAIQWASRCPAVQGGSVEIRPIMDYSGMMPQ